MENKAPHQTKDSEDGAESKATPKAPKDDVEKAKAEAGGQKTDAAEKKLKKALCSKSDWTPLRPDACPEPGTADSPERSVKVYGYVVSGYCRSVAKRPKKYKKRTKDQTETKSGESDGKDAAAAGDEDKHDTEAEAAEPAPSRPGQAEQTATKKRKPEVSTDQPPAKKQAESKSSRADNGEASEAAQRLQMARAAMLEAVRKKGVERRKEKRKRAERGRDTVRLTRDPRNVPVAEPEVAARVDVPVDVAATVQDALEQDVRDVDDM